MASTASHGLQVQLIVLLLQFFLLSFLQVDLLLKCLYRYLHLGNLQIHLAHLLPFFCQQGFITALFLCKLTLQLCRHLFLKLIDPLPLLLSELSPQCSLHLCVYVMRRLHVVYYLLLF